MSGAVPLLRPYASIAYPVTALLYVRDRKRLWKVCLVVSKRFCMLHVYFRCHHRHLQVQHDID